LKSNSRVIKKGKGIRDWKRLQREYGGDPKKWSKKSSIDEYGQEWHWYEYNGEVFELKPK